MRALDVESPEVHITVAADGSTNLPGGARRRPPPKKACNRCSTSPSNISRCGTAASTGTTSRTGFSIRGQGLRLGTRYEPAEERYALSFRLGEFGVELRPSRAVAFRSRRRGLHLSRPSRGAAAPGRRRGREPRSPRPHAGLAAARNRRRVQGPRRRRNLEDRLDLPFLGKGSAQFSGKLDWRGGAAGLTYSGNLEAGELDRRGQQRCACDCAPAPSIPAMPVARAAAQRRPGGLWRAFSRARPRSKYAANRGPGLAARGRLRRLLDPLGARGAAQERKSQRSPPTPPWRSQLSGWLRAEGSGMADAVAGGLAHSERAPAELPARRSAARAASSTSPIAAATNFCSSPAWISPLTPRASPPTAALPPTAVRFSICASLSRISPTSRRGSHRRHRNQGTSGRAAGRAVTAGKTRRAALSRPAAARLISPAGSKRTVSERRATIGDASPATSSWIPINCASSRRVLEDRDGSAQIILQIPLDDYRLSATGR